MRKIPVVHIEWLDSQTDIGWEAYSHSDHAPVCHTVGLMIAETESFAIIAHSFDPETNEWNGRMSIPLCSIKNVKRLCQIKI